MFIDRFRGIRWIIAGFLAVMMLTSVIASGSGPVRAQDAIPTAEAGEATQPEATESTQPDVEAVTTDDSVEEFSVDDAVIVADGPLNLRDAAGLDGEIVETLATSVKLVITAGPEAVDDFTWYQVETAAGDSGWVAGEFLALQGAGDAFAAGDLVTVVDGPLNMRDAAGLDADVVNLLDTGVTATVNGGPISVDDYDWYEIVLDDESTGWIASDFVALVEEEVPTGSDGQFSIGDAVVVAVEDLNFRDGPGTDFEVLDTLDTGSLFLVEDGPVTANGYTWYQVFNYYYGTGWIAGELATLSPEEFPPAATE